MNLHQLIAANRCLSEKLKSQRFPPWWEKVNFQESISRLLGVCSKLWCSFDAVCSSALMKRSWLVLKFILFARPELAPKASPSLEPCIQASRTSLLQLVKVYPVQWKGRQRCSLQEFFMRTPHQEQVVRCLIFILCIYLCNLDSIRDFVVNRVNFLPEKLRAWQLKLQNITNSAPI